MPSVLASGPHVVIGGHTPSEKGEDGAASSIIPQCADTNARILGNGARLRSLREIEEN